MGQRHAPGRFKLRADYNDVRHADEFRKTWYAMDTGIPVLHKVLLWAAELECYGIANLLFWSEDFYKCFPHLTPDKPEFDDFAYIANVARVNAAALASLALAPKWYGERQY